MLLPSVRPWCRSSCVCSLVEQKPHGLGFRVRAPLQNLPLCPVALWEAMLSNLDKKFAALNDHIAKQTLKVVVALIILVPDLSF